MSSRHSLHVPRSNNICVSNNKHEGISGGLMTKTVKDLKMSLDSTSLGVITRVKRDSIREVVQQPTS